MQRRNKRHINGYVILTNGQLEHRYVMEQYLGRKLESCELVHHINGDIEDNRLENLKLTDRPEHAHHHHIGIPKPPRKTGWHIPGKWKIFTCKTCGKKFGDHAYRNRINCSKKCAEYTLIKKGQHLNKDTEFKIKDSYKGERENTIC